MPIVIYDKFFMRRPVKVWTDDRDKVDEGTWEQALNMQDLPFTYKWPALMPDFHKGYGMPIGGVLATEGYIIPNAVGVDIGCGMGFVQTNIPASLLREVKTGSGTLAQSIIGAMMRSIPVGKARHKNKRPEMMERLSFEGLQNIDASAEGWKLFVDLEGHSTSFGTLGGGNHFIELQEDEEGYLGIMIHSGSRSLGAAVHKVYNAKAKEINERYFSRVPTAWGLSFLPTDSDEGQEYVAWMNLACDFAKENRSDMLQRVKEILFQAVYKEADFLAHSIYTLDIHHNYAALENHYGSNVWVHRKGAIRSRDREIGIIPGAMGSFSYLVVGKGNPESFHSAPHGAGRVMSRTEAKKTFTVEQVVADTQDFILGKHSMKDVAEEYRKTYKDIDEVMTNAQDLVTPIKKLKTVAVLKG